MSLQDACLCLGSVGHAVMNIEDNVSVTENYFLLDSLDDYIMG